MADIKLMILDKKGKKECTFRDMGHDKVRAMTGEVYILHVTRCNGGYIEGDKRISFDFPKG